MTRDEDIFADDTDIFADLPSNKSRSKKTKAKTSTGQTKSLFSSDDVGQCTVKCSSPLEFLKVINVCQMCLVLLLDVIQLK